MLERLLNQVNATMLTVGESHVSECCWGKCDQSPGWEIDTPLGRMHYCRWHVAAQAESAIEYWEASNARP